MSQPRPYPPLRAARLLPLATLGLVVGIILWLLISQARIELRETLLERARSEAPWAAVYLEKAPPGWVPMPWDGAQPDLMPLIADAARLNAGILAGTEMKRVTEASTFAEEATRWGEQVAFCRAAPSGDERFRPACAAIRGERLPDPWRAHFRRTFAADHYLTRQADGRVAAGRRARVGTTLCNAAPYAVRVGGLIEVASSDVVRAQEDLLGVRLQPLALARPSNVKPGACEQRTIRGYDGSGIVRFASEAVDPELVAWLHRQLRDQHPERSAAIASQPGQLGAVLPCGAGPESVAERLLARAFCRQGRNAILLSAAHRDPGTRVTNRHVVSDPLYYSVPPHPNPDGTVRPAFERIGPALAHIHDFGPIVETQFDMERKWKGKASAFTLGGTLRDDNSVLGEGVSIRGLPRLTIWDEQVTLPADGEIVQINDRPIFSIWDIHDELARHGTSRSFGVHKPLSLVYRIHGPTGVGYQEGKVLMRFDTSVPQAFETGNQWWLGIKSGAFARWYTGACLVTESTKAFFNLFGAGLRVRAIGECAWIVHQQVAYAMQVDPQWFKNWEEVGRAIVVAALTKGIGHFAFGTRLALTRHLSGFAYLKSAGGLRSTLLGASLDGLWAMGMQPPSTPIENRLYAFAPKAGMSFIETATNSLADSLISSLQGQPDD